MGLDMYLEGEKYLHTLYDEEGELVEPSMEDGFKLKRKVLELGYWRKQPNLHGFIVNEFANGVDNCEPIHLTADDMRAIIAAIREDRLPATQGFFFGSHDNSVEQCAQDIDTFERAIAWLKTEDKASWRSVYYRASW